MRYQGYGLRAMDKRGTKTVYRCDNPPCIHIVVDERRGIYKVFVEDYDRIIPIPGKELAKACSKLASSVSRGRLREATEGETDFLARRYLEAEPVEE